MSKYLWALGNGEIVSAEYESAKDALSNEQVRSELLSAFQQFGHSARCEIADEQFNEVYKITLENEELTPIVICAKGTTPGGRSNLNDEQRTQQKSKHINYAYQQMNLGKVAVQLGVYKREGQIIFCAWKLKQSSSEPETPISKQIKIGTIAQAMRDGFVQQSKGAGEYACAFRKEFIFFYIQNASWLHGSEIVEINNHNKSLAKIQLNNFPYNRILFGAPGTGKSFTLNEDRAKLLADGGEYERVTFHPDYSYANFVGAYKPVMFVDKTKVPNNADNDIISILLNDSKNAQEKYDLLYDKLKNDNLTRIPILLGLYTDESFKTRKLDGTDAVGDNVVERNHGRAIRPYVSLLSNKQEKGEISYEYVAGPFVRTLVKALKSGRTENPKPYLLIIEEINRANAAAVFGDVFQLLDRKDGASEYAIQTSRELREYLAKPENLGGKPADYEEIRIPDNMFIWATMNSADQGVYPMDTAFKRRWDFTYIGIDDGENEAVIKNNEKVVIETAEKGSQYINWNNLRKAINKKLDEDCQVNEDKLMGPFFISPTALTDEKFKDAFKNKVLMYLCEDVLRHRGWDKLFEKIDGMTHLSYAKVCNAFDKKGMDIFVSAVRNAEGVIVSKENDKAGAAE